MNHAMYRIPGHLVGIILLAVLAACGGTQGTTPSSRGSSSPNVGPQPASVGTSNVVTSVLPGPNAHFPSETLQFKAKLLEQLNSVTTTGSSPAPPSGDKYVAFKVSLEYLGEEGVPNSQLSIADVVDNNFELDVLNGPESLVQPDVTITAGKTFDQQTDPSLGTGGRLVNLGPDYTYTGYLVFEIPVHASPETLVFQMGTPGPSTDSASWSLG